CLICKRQNNNRIVLTIPGKTGLLYVCLACAFGMRVQNQLKGILQAV
ncbi:MAG: hypothetical protein ACI8R4_003700, partial [Paracoccaceae bacterium]